MRGIVYIHVPKCGGTSFGTALRMRYAWSQAVIRPRPGPPCEDAQARAARIVREYDRRDAVLARHLAAGTRCISGHVRYDPRLQDRHPDHAFVTLLRDPVERFVSHYHHLQRRHPDAGRPDTLEAFLDTPDAARLGAQYLFYFARTWPGDDAEAGVPRAVAALARFALVGSLDRPKAFRQALARLAGGPIPPLARNRAPQGSFAPDGDLRRRIETLCAADIAIYDAARNLAAAA